ncbi:hypothetical protein BDR05DRAFT_953778 [Suillus weaverae]|nr:hypothetical protein BDR05DRAFT_953778 [Suillus weaverae]
MYDGDVHTLQGTDCVIIATYNTRLMILHQLDDGACIQTYNTDPVKTFPKQVVFGEKATLIIGGSNAGIIYVFDKNEGTLKARVTTRRQGARSALKNFVREIFHLAVAMALMAYISMMQFMGQHITSGISLESLGEFWQKPVAQAHELMNDDICVLVETYIQDRRVEQYTKDRRMGNDLEIEPSSVEKRKLNDYVYQTPLDITKAPTQWSVYISQLGFNVVVILYIIVGGYQSFFKYMHAGMFLEASNINGWASALKTKALWQAHTIELTIVQVYKFAKFPYSLPAMILRRRRCIKYINYRMSKHVASNDDVPTVKHLRIDEGSRTAPLVDEGAWRILEDYLTTNEWKEAQHVLFSGDGDDDVALENLCVVKAKHPCVHKVCSTTDRQLSWACVRPSCKPTKHLHLKNPYIDLYAGEDDDDEEVEEDFNDEGKEDDDHARKVMRLPGSLLATRFTAIINHLMRNITDYIAEHLWKKEFHVTVSAWLAGQLYMLADSPKTISNSLPFSLYLTVKQYVRISDEECEAVEWSHKKIPNPAWVRIKHEKYKGNIAQVFDSDLPNNFIVVLVPPQDFPYSMPCRSQSLLDQSCLPNGDAISNISIGEEVIGCKYKGERYYMGLLLKNNPSSALMLTTFNSTYNLGGIKPSSKQLFLVCGQSAGSVTLALKFSGFRKEVDVQLEDIEHIFQVSNSVRVVAGPYLGVEGYIIQMVDNIIHLCQDVSKEELEVSRYYIDGHPLSHTLQAQLPTQQLFKPPPSVESIQIGDSIDVLVGEHIGKSGIRIPNLQTLQFMQDRGYNVKAGDVVKVAHGPEYSTKGVVQSVDFPNAHLTLLAETDHSPVDMPIRFIIKVCNTSLYSFKKDIGQEVYIIGGDHKGYRAMLYS